MGAPRVRAETDTIEVGIGPLASPLIGSVARRAAVLRHIADSGLDHVGVNDHVSFQGGTGTDGLFDARALLSLHDTLAVWIAVYLLPLRHPTLVARQLSAIGQSTPGRLVFGVGVGGEDPAEYAACGIDPATRGRRMDESLVALRGLMSGRPTSVDGEFVQLDDAVVAPPCDPAPPVMVGGRSDAALTRTGRFGDGWIGLWVSARRYADAVCRIGREATSVERFVDPAAHAMYVWCGAGPTAADGAAHVARAMEQLYRIPFSKFERYTPVGRPADIAAALAPYVDAGCRRFHLALQARTECEAIDTAAEVKVLLDG